MHVCICLSLSDGVLCRPTLKTLQAVCGLTSIFSSLVESSLFRIHPPLCPCLMVTVPLRLRRGWSTYTGLHILSCVGCQPSWLSGLVRTCRMSWDFPTKADQRAEPGSGWTPAELNHILQSHVVDGALSTFGCVDWESDLCRGVMRARCYPFDMPKHHFHGFNPQVLVHTLQRHVHTCYIHVCIISIW